MKQYVIIFLSFIFSIQVFATEIHQKKGLDILPNSTVEALKTRRDLLRSWAADCKDGSLTMENCPFWDAVEYMGMLCLSGEERYCEQVKNSQEESTGRWFRSPGYKLIPDAFPDGETFSRDMLVGVFGYVVQKRDQEALLKYMNYINGNSNRLCPKPLKGKWDACRVGLGAWALFTELYDNYGIRRIKKMNNFKFLIRGIYNPIEARLQPKDYQLILTAEGIYTRMKMLEYGYKIRNKNLNRNVSKILASRVPENGFFEFLSKGPTVSAANKILKMCPTTKPDVALSAEGNPIYTEPGNGPWEKGSGHYCIFMINALLGSAN